MVIGGLIETASVVKAHAGGKSVDLAPYTAALAPVLVAEVGQSLRVDLEPGDVYTTIRRHFQNAGKELGICLSFRKVVEGGVPVALLVAQGTDISD